MNTPTQVNLLIQDHSSPNSFQGRWDIPRTRKATYFTDKPSQNDSEEIPEEAFEFTNNPRFQKDKTSLPEGLQNYRGPSLSVGDAVEVIDQNKKSQEFLCTSFGWKKKEA